MAQYDEHAVKALVDKYEDDHFMVHGYCARMPDGLFDKVAGFIHEYSKQDEISKQHIYEYLIDNSTDWED